MMAPRLRPLLHYGTDRPVQTTRRTVLFNETCADSLQAQLVRSRPTLVLSRDAETLFVGAFLAFHGPVLGAQTDGVSSANGSPACLMSWFVIGFFADLPFSPDHLAKAIIVIRPETFIASGHTFVACCQ